MSALATARTKLASQACEDFQGAAHSQPLCRGWKNILFRVKLAKTTAQPFCVESNVSASPSPLPLLSFQHLETQVASTQLSSDVSSADGKHTTSQPIALRCALRWPQTRDKAVEHTVKQREGAKHGKERATLFHSAVVQHYFIACSRFHDRAMSSASFSFLFQCSAASLLRGSSGFGADISA